MIGAGAAAPTSSAVDPSTDADDVSQATTAEQSDETSVSSVTTDVDSSASVTADDTVDVSVDASDGDVLESALGGLESDTGAFVESLLTGFGVTDLLDGIDEQPDETDEGDDDGTDEDDADDGTDEDDADDGTDEDDADDGTEDDDTDEADDEDDVENGEEDESDDADDGDDAESGDGDGDETDDEDDAGDGDETDETDDSDELDRAAIEQYAHEAVNEERAAHGVDELEFDAELRDIARAHSEDMAERGYFAHVDPEGNDFADRYEEAGYECNVNGYTGGENIAQTWYDVPVDTEDGTVQYEDEQELGYGIVDQWMNSPDHRENLLADQWENQGIGIYVTDDGQVYATQNFC